MSNTRIVNRFTSILIAVVLLVALSLATAAPAAAAPTADRGAEVGPAWSGLISWSFTGWMAEVFDWACSVRAESRITADPDGTSTSGMDQATVQTTTWDWSIDTSNSLR